MNTIKKGNGDLLTDSDPDHALAFFGIEAALEEIEKNKGVLYDETVANACLKLFREKNCQLKQDGETNPI